MTKKVGLIDDVGPGEDIGLIEDVGHIDEIGGIDVSAPFSGHAGSHRRRHRVQQAKSVVEDAVAYNTRFTRSMRRRQDSAPCR